MFFTLFTGSIYRIMIQSILQDNDSNRFNKCRNSLQVAPSYSIKTNCIPFTYVSSKLKMAWQLKALTLLYLLSLLVAASAQHCGTQAGGALCQQGLCCSIWGWCGNTPPYCSPGNCQSQCPLTPPPPSPPPPPPSPPPPSPPPPPPSPPPPSPPPPPSLPPPITGQCGTQGGGALCPQGLCCSIWGWCGNTPPYCSPGNCQSQCPSTPTTPPPPPPPPLGPTPPPPPITPSPPGEDISSLITSTMFDEMLLHRNNNACPAKGFYTYDAFITAAKSFPGFATNGDIDTRKRELAAFFAQTSHETTGGWPTAPDGPYAWGYCFLEEIGGGDYCVPNIQWPCAPGKQYYGRGPIQLSYNYNYGPCGEALGLDLLNNPNLVASDPVIAFKTALWFWMTPQPPKPSCHDVLIGNWTPSPSDIAANRLPGLGVTTNIINGGLECGHGPDARVQSRIGFFMRYCDMFGVSYGDNLDCFNQTSFGWGLLADAK